MNGLIDVRQVGTQILGFLILLWGMKKFAWGPMLRVLEARRQKIASEFAEAERRQAEADQARARYELELKGIDALARQRIQQAATEGERVAAEIRAQAQRDAADRVARAEDEIAREREKAKVEFKDQVIRLSMRSAEKILREKLDDAHQRRLVDEFIDEAEAIR